mmetsp:Transcript_48052/g.120121  ORF Transcript_48052/g.120121 Transcript_48052/m.120121 type:complete len:244 (+) Transcript_48052:744-1475(+)
MQPAVQEKGDVGGGAAPEVSLGRHREDLLVQPHKRRHKAVPHRVLAALLRVLVPCLPRHHLGHPRGGELRHHGAAVPVEDAAHGPCAPQLARDVVREEPLLGKVTVLHRGAAPLLLGAPQAHPGAQRVAAPAAVVTRQRCGNARSGRAGGGRSGGVEAVEQAVNLRLKVLAPLQRLAPPLARARRRDGDRCWLAHRSWGGGEGAALRLLLDGRVQASDLLQQVVQVVHLPHALSPSASPLAHP